jgi:hypothetical protein
MCLERGEILATGADVKAAVPVRTSDGWYVRVTFTPTATARLHRQSKDRLVHEIMDGWLLNEIWPATPVLVGNGAALDQEDARQLAIQLRPPRSRARAANRSPSAGHARRSP